MNLMWINQLNLLHEQERKELSIYHENRTRPLLKMIEESNQVKQQAIKNANVALLNVLNNKYD
jgi:hypothetical protein